MGAISGIFAATGQTCIAGSRLLVQRSIHDKFVGRLLEVAGAAKLVIRCRHPLMWAGDYPAAV